MTNANYNAEYSTLTQYVIDERPDTIGNMITQLNEIILRNANGPALEIFRQIGRDEYYRLARKFPANDIDYSITGVRLVIDEILCHYGENPTIPNLETFHTGANYDK